MKEIIFHEHASVFDAFPTLFDALTIVSNDVTVLSDNVTIVSNDVIVLSDNVTIVSDVLTIASDDVTMLSDALAVMFDVYAIGVYYDSENHFLHSPAPRYYVETYDAILVALRYVRTATGINPISVCFAFLVKNKDS